MARPRKATLEYFPLNCVLDEKFEAMESEFGNDGFAVPIKIFQAAYQTENGEVIFTDVFRRKILIRRSGVSEERFLSIMEFATEIDLFDKKKWMRGVITSDGIKSRLATVQKLREKERFRKGSFPAENAGTDYGKRAENLRKTPQSKVKESKSSFKEESAAGSGKNFSSRPKKLTTEELVEWARKKDQEEAREQSLVKVSQK